MKIKFLSALGLAIGCFLLSSCQPDKGGDDEGFKVLTTFTILQDMAQNVAGEHAEVVSITKPGAEIHDYEVTPQDLVRAQGADLILHNGLGLERWFSRFHEQLEGVREAVLSDGIEPLSISEGPYSGKPNPHAWMSPDAAMVYVENIRKALSEADPENAKAYEKNAREYQEKLKAVAEPIRAKLSQIPEEKRLLVTSEGAFTYLAQAYGMKQLYLWPVNADEAGTPQQVRKVIDEVRESGVPVVFSESTISDKPMKQVAKETGVKYGGVLYVDSLTGPEGPAATFVDLLKTNAETIVAGFGF